MSISDYAWSESGAEPQRAECTATHLVVVLQDGRLIATPLWWYPRLLDARPDQRSRLRLSRIGVHWADLDEDLSIEGMLAGRRAPGAQPPAPQPRLALP